MRNGETEHSIILNGPEKTVTAEALRAAGLEEVAEQIKRMGDEEIGPIGRVLVMDSLRKLREYGIRPDVDAVLDSYHHLVSGSLGR